MGQMERFRFYFAAFLVILTVFVCAGAIDANPAIISTKRAFEFIPVFISIIYLVGRLLTGTATFGVAEVTPDMPRWIKLGTDILALLLMAFFMVRLWS